MEVFKAGQKVKLKTIEEIELILKGKIYPGARQYCGSSFVIFIQSRPGYWILQNCPYEWPTAVIEPIVEDLPNKTKKVDMTWHPEVKSMMDIIKNDLKELGFINNEPGRYHTYDGPRFGHYRLKKHKGD